MTASVFFQGSNEIAVLTNTFSVSGTPTDPATVSVVITDPVGTAITHTYLGTAPADVTKGTTGVYTLNIPCVTTGLWSFVWIGTGPASDIQAGTWTVNPVFLEKFYCSVEELRDRLKITSGTEELSLQMAVQSAARWVEGVTGRYFWQGPDVRTYVPYDLYEQPIDDLVSITSLKVDLDGDGTFEQAWVLNSDYQLMTDGHEFNTGVTGEQRPYTKARVSTAQGGGRFFPFIWPFSPLNRVQVTGVFGWPAVPLAIKQATLQVATDFYKLKDAPFGVAGSAEFGQVRVTPAASAYALLTPYIHARRKVGV